MSDRYRTIVDVHLLLVRDGLLLWARRARTGYADGLLNLVSGHLEASEDVVAAVIREAGEEAGIEVRRDGLTCVHVMHYRNPEGQPRIGFFFRPARWDGEPVNREPHKCSGLEWHPLEAVPSDAVPYPAEAVRRIGKGETFSVHGWA